jgi:hypothetical protein
MDIPPATDAQSIPVPIHWREALHPACGERDRNNGHHGAPLGAHHQRVAVEKGSVDLTSASNTQ